LVDKLALIVLPHPKPYKLHWLNEVGFDYKSTSEGKFLLWKIWRQWFMWHSINGSMLYCIG